MNEPSKGELFFEAMRHLGFPSLAPVRLKQPSYWTGDGQYETEIEAIMSSKPLTEPKESTEGIHWKNEALAKAIVDTFNQLTEEEQWVYHMLVDVGLSMRFVATVLDIPKTTFARRRDALADKIKGLLLEHEVVRERLRL